MKVLPALSLGALAFAAAKSAPTSPAGVPSSDTCVCKVTAGQVSATPWDKCPCQRWTYCWWGGSVPTACCTLDPDDQETPCVSIVLGDSLAQPGVCKIPDHEECNVAGDCAMKQDVKVIIAECCSSTSQPGGVGVTGTIDCSAAKCCKGDTITVWGGGAPDSATGLGSSVSFRATGYSKCGSPAAPQVIALIKCTPGSIYDVIGNVEVAGFGCDMCEAGK